MLSSNFTLKTLAKVLGIALIGAAFGYLGGRVQGLIREAEIREEMESIESDRAATQAQLARSEAKAKLLEARRHLSMARGQVEARNFGMAQGMVEKARESAKAAEGALPKQASAALKAMKPLNLLLQKDWTEHHKAVREAIRVVDSQLVEVSER